MPGSFGADDDKPLYLRLDWFKELGTFEFEIASLVNGTSKALACEFRIRRDLATMYVLFGPILPIPDSFLIEQSVQFDLERRPKGQGSPKIKLTIDPMATSEEVVRTFEWVRDKLKFPKRRPLRLKTYGLAWTYTGLAFRTGVYERKRNWNGILAAWDAWCIEDGRPQWVYWGKEGDPPPEVVYKFARAVRKAVAAVKEEAMAMSYLRPSHSALR